MGRQKWSLGQGKPICNYKIENSIQLSFSQCYPGKFTCDTGKCILLDERCNIELNCDDQTDENNCVGVKPGNQYVKEKIPVALNAEPTIIYINISLLALPIISTKDVKFAADFYLNVRWHDLRLDMWDLDHDFAKNSLSKEEIDTLWMPELGFVNSLLSESYIIQPLKGTLIKENGPLMEDISLATEGNPYGNY